MPSTMTDLAVSHKGSFIKNFPLLAFVLIAYNIAIAMGHSFAPAAEALVRLPLISGAVWALGLNDAFVIVGLAILFVEIIKSTRPTGGAALEHLLSMLVFIIFLVEFLVVAGAGTNTFLTLGLMSLIDVMGGYTISIAVARKEMNITN
jgi:hypothetical protein